VLLAAGADYEVWRPADALDGRIKAQLARLRGDRHDVAG
jgi:hypothetical protein